MKFDFKAILEKIKEFWAKLTKKTKILACSIGGGVLVLLILLTVILNTRENPYRVLFPGMSNEEATQVYATLQEMDVQPQIDNRGQILVPSEQWDNLVFQLNGKGYPKSTLSYDTFSSMSGFTSTEFEKRTALIFEAQNRMQQTLLRQVGIEDAVVTFTVPETSNYIWDQANRDVSRAGVTVRMKPGYELTPERVTAIKHLASTSVPNLDPDDVVVVDGDTGLEMPGVDDPSSAGYYSVQRLEYERLIAEQLENNVKRLLSARYGSDGVTAVATVVLDYDKMMSEQKEYRPAQDGGNSGVINHYQEDYSLNGTVSIGGIVGEENNTDTPPIYPNEDGTGDASTTDYHKEINYDVSYILTQIERGEPILERATIAVIVNDPDFDLDVEETLISLISRATNITSDNISVTNLNFTVPAGPTPNDGTGFQLTRQQIILLIIVGGALLLLIIVLIVVLSILRKRKKKKQQEEEEAAAAAAELAESAVQTQEEIEREIEEHKRMLQNEALANSNQKENAITQEIRDFAKENPEITAALLRSMLKEEE